MTTNTNGSTGTANFLAIVLIVLSGVTAILGSVYITEVTDSLWAFLLILFQLENLNRKNGATSLRRGFIGFAGNIAVFAAVVMTGNANVLWALLLVNFLMEAID